MKVFFLASVLFLLGCLHTSTAYSYSGGISGVHGFGTTTPSTCANSGCHTAAVYGENGLNWTNGSGGAEPTSITVGNATSFGLKLTRVLSLGMGFNVAARKNTGDSKFGGFTATGIQKIIATNEITHVSSQSPTTEWQWTFTPDELADFKLWGCVNQVNNDASNAGDGRPVCGTRSISVTNTTPVTTNDSGGLLTIGEHGNVTDFDVFSNDAKTDPDGHTVTFNSFGTLPTNVTNPSGTNISFSPPANTYDFLDTGESQNIALTYTLKDSWSTSTAGTVTIRVNGENDAPIITEGPESIAQAINEDNSLALTLNATDVESNALTWSIASQPTTGTGSATTTSGAGNSNVIGYTPPANYIGPASFVVQVTDDGTGLLTDTITVNVTVGSVNDAPIITEGDGPILRAIDEDNSPTAFALTLNATDVENNTLTWSIASQPTTGTGSATTTSGAGNSNVIGYTPPANYIGPASFVVQVTDDGTGLLTDTITVNVTVGSVNDAPIITEGDGPILRAIDEDNSPTAFALTLNATDVENNTLTWSIASQPTTGTGSATTTSGAGNSNVIGYTPPANYIGPASFVVQVTDDGTGLLTDTITVNVTVGSVNDAPIITKGDGPMLLIIDEDNSPSAFNLMLNATDADLSDILTWSVSSHASNGIATASGTGISKAIAYTPNLNYNGVDSFTVQVSDGVLTDTILVDLTINPRNDGLAIIAVGPQSSTEGTLLTFSPVVEDPDDVNNGTDISWTFVSGKQAGMSLSNIGVFTWTVPLGPPAVFGQTYVVTIRAADDLSHGVIADDDTFVITINPPDTDGDLVADYDDLCLTISDATNADNDGDGTAGSDGGTNVGGDVCDLDDDNDGIPDTFEAANGLDSFDAADAALDADGDGISNLDEFLAGSNLNFAIITIDSTGYLTPYTLVKPEPTIVAAGATAVTGSATGVTTVAVGIDTAYRAGHYDVTWTAFNSSDTSLGTSVQSFDVRPIVSFAADQLSDETGTVTVKATLNGQAANYPVVVTYNVSGTADSSDHNAVPGSFSFTSPNQISNFSFEILADTLVEGTETVVFTLVSVVNAVISSDATHTVSIVEGNAVPAVNLRLSQNGNTVSKAYVSEGAVTVDALVTDPNSAQTHSFDWSRTSNSLLPPTDNTVTNWTFIPTVGNHLIGLVVIDSGSPSLSNTISQIINVSVDAVPTLKDLNGNDIDSDGDSVLDIDEGFGDSDQDGIPDYLDAQSNGAADQHLIPNQTAATDNATWFLVQTEPGIKILTGNTSRASNNSGAIVTDANIGSFGSALGGAPLNASDDFEHVGGIYDFELSGLVPGRSANIVIPLQSAIPIDASFRKFKSDTGWSGFVADNNNRVSSAPGILGTCPETGSSQYIDGLVAFSNCLQLTIQDGGPNDADGVANGVIKDPGSLSITLKSPVTPTVRGSGRIDIVMLLGLFLLICCRVCAYNRINC
jgi:VCBS repeat-containing protein